MAEIFLEDKGRSCDRALKSNRFELYGPSLKNHNLQRMGAEQYIVKIKHTIFIEKDLSKNCQNYPTKAHDSYNSVMKSL